MTPLQHLVRLPSFSVAMGRGCGKGFGKGEGKGHGKGAMGKKKSKGKKKSGGKVRSAFSDTWQHACGASEGKKNISFQR